MKKFEQCPICGGDLENKQVEKLLRGGENIVSIKVTAEVCLHCGEKIYTEDIIKLFESVRNKLKKHEFSHFKTLGQSFTIKGDWHNKAVHPTVFG